MNGAYKLLYFTALGRQKKKQQSSKATGPV